MRVAINKLNSSNNTNGEIKQKLKHITGYYVYHLMQQAK